MRLFLAINLPDNIKEKIDYKLKALKEEYQDLKWVGSKNYHITVHFFGERELTDKMTSKIEEASFDANSFYMYSSVCELTIRQKVFAYLGFSKNKKLEKIALNMRNTFNMPLAYKYMPHITLARYRIPSKQQYLLLKKKFSNLDIDVSFKVSKLTLFDCINYSVQPEYKIVKEFNLLES
jgi:2'-5' RNA ligase